MLIEDEKLLHEWIAKDVEPISDAESEALAKYVLALIKKPLPEGELEKMCLNRLEDFLQSHTKAFVHRLFDCVRTAAYLPEAAKQEHNKRRATSTSAATITTPVSTISTSAQQLSAVVAISQQQQQHHDDILLDDEVLENDYLLAEEGDQDAGESGDDNDASSTTSSSASGSKRSAKGKGKPHQADTSAGKAKEKEGGSSSNTRTQSSDRRRPAPAQGEVHHGGSSDTKRSRYSQRLLDISPIRNSSAGGQVSISSTSTTISGSRAGGGGSRARTSGGGGGYASQSTRGRSTAGRRRSWSRERERGNGGTGGRDGSRSRSPRSRSPLYTGAERKRTGGSGVGDSNISRHRCKDFHEKGFCMRGDKCPYDHGPDPVVVENTSAALETLVGGGAGYNPPPPGMEKSYVSAVGLAAGCHEGYNPEAPALTATGIAGLPHAAPPPPANFSLPPPPLPAGLTASQRVGAVQQMQFSTHYPPPPGVGGVGASTMSGGRGGYGAGMQQPHFFNAPPPGIPGATSGLATTGMPGALIDSSGSIPLQSAAAQLPLQPPRFTRPMGMRGGLGMGIGGEQRGHRYRPYGFVPRLGATTIGGVPPAGQSAMPTAATHPAQLQQPSQALCSLLVKKIPEELNKIHVLDQHFGKFGQITNLHVHYEGRSDAALVTYRTRREAMAAYRSTEPILNNRFIRVFWQVPNVLAGSATGDQQLLPDEEGSGAPTQEEVCKDAMKPPVDLNRSFAKVFGGSGGGGAPAGSNGQQYMATANPRPRLHANQAPNVPLELGKAGEDEEEAAGDESDAPPSSINDDQRPPAPRATSNYNHRAVAAKRRAEAESLQRMREVHRRKAELFTKLSAQLKELLEKVKTAPSQEVKKKLMQLVKKVDGNVSTVRSELETLGKQLTELKLRTDTGAKKSKAFNQSSIDPADPGGEGETDENNGRSADGDGSPSSGKKALGKPLPHLQSSPMSRIAAEADRRKLFRVVHVSGCPSELRDELIAHMENFGDLFDFEISSSSSSGRGTGGTPSVFTYKNQADAQRAVNEAAAGFASSAPIKVQWAPASLGQSEGVVPDRERKPAERMTPQALLAAIDFGEDDEEEDDDAAAAASEGGLEEQGADDSGEEEGKEKKAGVAINK